MIANNASLFDDSEDDAELDEPLSKRVRMAETSEQVSQACFCTVSEQCTQHICCD